MNLSFEWNIYQFVDLDELRVRVRVLGGCDQKASHKVRVLRNRDQKATHKVRVLESRDQKASHKVRVPQKS